MEVFDASVYFPHVAPICGGIPVESNAIASGFDIARHQHRVGTKIFAASPDGDPIALCQRQIKERLRWSQIDNLGFAISWLQEYDGILTAGRPVSHLLHST